jgi:hypothetical protein
LTDTFKCEVCGQHIEGASEGQQFKNHMLHVYALHPDVVESQDAVGKNQFLDLCDVAAVNGPLCEGYVASTKKRHDMAAKTWVQLAQALNETLAISDAALNILDRLTVAEKKWASEDPDAAGKLRENIGFLQLESKRLKKGFSCHR